jgi:DNA processing protein
MLVARDRLQSGLSLGVFPIETNVTGGTMHTVGFAEGQDRLLFCPDLDISTNYPPGSPGSQGVKMLIREKRAEKYTKKDYDTILKKLSNKKSELFPKETDPADNKGDPVQEDIFPDIP